jgi:carbonic anhydrase
MNEIREKSPALATMEKEGKILIVGGVYDLESGEVFFLES